MMKRFLFVGEGLTDYIVIKNLLIGFFNDKNLSISRLIPRDKEPVGWGNVLNYLTTSEFQDSLDNTDFIIIQIDTDKCEEWKEGLYLTENPDILIKKTIEVLIKKIGLAFFAEQKDKILFAISVHDIECWLLPFITDKPAHQSKTVGCVKAVEQIANKRGFSINQKNYENGKHYEELSREMRNNKELMRKYSLNESLKTFVDRLIRTTSPPKEEELE